MSIEYDREHPIPAPTLHPDNEGYWEGVKRQELLSVRELAPSAETHVSPMSVPGQGVGPFQGEGDGLHLGGVSGVTPSRVQGTLCGGGR